ncbi:DNA adenine methylase, partial [candidate division KSB1 bacterium]|nr:DNA adenine methylase [candidate division KSB1 bacterium]
SVTANDLADWSYTFGLCYLKNTKPAAYYQPILDSLNALRGKNGWFTENYGGRANSALSDARDGYKKIWQTHNTRKLDAVREEIDRLNLPPAERAVLLTSLILAMDRVDSTLGHQVSYLKQWAPRSYKTMELRVPFLIENRKPHTVVQGDIFDLVTKKKKFDLAYFDPPYGSSNEKMPPSRVRYASYYHLWTTICRNDRPELVGAAKRRADTSDTMTASIFEEFRKSESGKYIVVEAIERLIKNTRAKYIVLSYSNQGRATRDELTEVVRGLGHNYLVLQIDHKSHVMTSMRWTHEWASPDDGRVKEYLFVMSRSEDLRAVQEISGSKMPRSKPPLKSARKPAARATNASGARVAEVDA